METMESVMDVLNVEKLRQVAELSSWAMIAVGAMTLLATLFITAPYGKFSKDKGWGFLIPATRAWMIMESPNLWMPFFILAMLPTNIAMQSFITLPTLLSPSAMISDPSLFFQNPNLVILSLFLLHYIHRDLIFPQFLFAGNPMPISVMFLAFLFCSWNATNQALTLLFGTQYDHNLWWSSPQTLVGIFLFFVGMAINIHVDYSLLAQKRRSLTQGVQYIIPKGFFFDLVSCPNYMGEILEWLGFALAANNLAAWAFVWYTTSNLAPRALAQHRWYMQKFEDYPKSRRAIIPFIL